MMTQYCNTDSLTIKAPDGALPRAAGKGLQQPLWTAGTSCSSRTHNLGSVGLSPSSASKKAESSFLDPGLSIYDKTTGILLWATATSPFFQHQGTPSTPSSTRVSLPCRFIAFNTDSVPL